MLSSLLDLIKSTAFVYISATLTCVGIAFVLEHIRQTMGLRFFLLALGGVLLCILLVAAIVLLWKVLERRRGDKMESALGQDAVARQQQRQQAKVAVQGIKDRWAEAMVTLKATKVRIYDLPWVLLIGEPQSGKTTTLRESGLDFPLGKDSLSGAGGTVNCDWWFTNEAVILDTAGRFTMPVDSAPDREEWQSFLKLLASHRPRCPINGVVVTIPSTSLLQDSPETLKKKALTIREKLQELVTVLGIEFPVYIMISKLDLVYGFAEFCASLSSEERKQALGWNCQNMIPQAFKQDEFDTFFAAVVGRLGEWARRRLRELNPGSEADRVYAFPGEFHRLKDALAGYLSLIFRPDRYHISLLLRGCYFSSGLQEGKSIARALLEGAEAGNKGVLAEFARSFVQSRAYFINAFYTKVFRERWLVRRAGGATKREILLRFTAAGFAVLFIAVAGAMLFFGYKSLVYKVQPLETQVRKAQALLLGGKAGGAASASEIVQIMNSLEAGRQDIIHHGAKRFLRTSGNVLVEDIGRIEDALFERKFLDILVTAAGKDFNDEKSIATLEDKERLYNILMQYIDMISGKPITVQTMSFLLDAIAWKSPGGPDVERAEAERIIQLYPYYRGAGKNPRHLEAGELYVRQALTGVYRFWGSFYRLLWQDQKRKFALINSTYAELLGANVSAADEGTGNVNERFMQSTKNFKEAIAAIDPKASGKIPVWTAALRDKCTTDYVALQDRLAGAGLKEMELMAGTAKRHAEVCSQLETGIGSEWAAAVEHNSHIVAPDGSLNPEMYTVRDTALKVADFGSLFTAEMKERLKSEGENPLPVLDSWNQGWLKSRDERVKEITAQLDKVKNKGWQGKELFVLCNDLLNNAVLQADQEVVMEALQVVLPMEANPAPALGSETPKSMRAPWLASRFKTLQKMGDWFQSRHPGSPGLIKARAAIGDKMKVSWSNCLKFWSERLNKVDPAGGILKTSSWQSFRKEVLARRGVFIDLGAWPLNAFFEFMAIKDVQEIKTIMNAQGGGTLLASGDQALEQKIENLATVYAASRFLPQLDEAQSTFASIVENLSDDPRGSFQMLKSGKPGDALSMDKFKSLGKFQERVNRDPAGRGEPMALQLAKIETHALSLLQKEFSSGYGKEWGDFVGTWRSRLGDKFPFGHREGWTGGDIVTTDVRKLILLTQPKNDLYDFFFSPEKGLEAFAKKYNISLSDTPAEDSSIHLSRADKIFLENSLAWRDFLFDKERRPRKHQVRITLDDEQGESSLNAQKYFTQLLLTGLGNDKDSSIKLRFSGQRFKSAIINWEMGLNPEIYMEAKNEETGLTTAIRLSGGSLAFPAYAIWEGRKGKSSASGDLRLNMVFPKGGVDLGASYYLVPITISWDQILPDNIPWPSR